MAQDNLVSVLNSYDEEYVVDILALCTNNDIYKTFCSHIGWSVTQDKIVNISRDNIHMYYGFNFR